MRDGLDVPRLVTQRLLLREWRDADRGPFAALNADPDVAEFLGEPLAREASDRLVDRIVARWAADGFGLWAVERVDDGAFLGFTGLSVPSFAPGREVEVGWRLARFAWGHGYATEAARAALRFGFGVLGLPEIVSYTSAANLRSRRVMERLGMARDAGGDFPHPAFQQGHPLRAHVTYRLTRESAPGPPSGQVVRAPVLVSQDGAGRRSTTLASGSRSGQVVLSRAR